MKHFLLHPLQNTNTLATEVEQRTTIAVIFPSTDYIRAWKDTS